MTLMGEWKYLEGRWELDDTYEWKYLEGRWELDDTYGEYLEGRWELDDTYGRVEVLRGKVGT